MVLKTARTGRNAGNQFWGCASYPGCRGTRPFDSSVTFGRSSERSGPNLGAVADDELEDRPILSVPVPWSDAIVRSDWVTEYAQIGAIPGIVRDQLDLRDHKIARLLGGTLMLTRRDRPRSGDDGAVLTSSLLVKLLQRGRIPLVTTRAEQRALEDGDLIRSCRNLADASDDIGWIFDSGVGQTMPADALIAAASRRVPLVPDPEFVSAKVLSSPDERIFWLEWIPARLGPGASQWFTPQASLDRLLEASGRRSEGARRVDFLFAHPSGHSIVIEIDGPEHAASEEADRQRDAELIAIGIPVLRVKNEEVAQGSGPQLDSIAAICLEVLGRHPPPERPSALALATIACSEAAKVQYGLARALGAGWLGPGGAWKISLSGASPSAAAGVVDACELLDWYDVIYGTTSAPSSVEITLQGESFGIFARGGEGRWVKVDSSAGEACMLHISVERDRGPCHAISETGADVILRPAYLPLDFGVEHGFQLPRRKATLKSVDNARSALTGFLRQIFRKKEFRQLQAEGVYNALRHVDCIILLPTGAGKSIIYQLAGLLMPGVTLVVDPIIALIEDQVEGLARYGIDRAAAIIRSTQSQEERDNFLLRIERGEYQFVLHSPERLQSPQFRATLHALAQSTQINLAVIDEAHCVSEWGHDFRPAYLNLGRNIRRLGRDKQGVPPPLIALTGTASRAVLRDVVAELDIDRSRSDALIRPSSFDRRELTFQVVRTSPSEDPSAAFRGVLASLPQQFGMPRGEFFRPGGRGTYSGLVFVPHTNGAMYGVLSVAGQVRNVSQTDVTIYSGKAPRGVNPRSWDSTKRANAGDFKANRTPILVSTKAFGMGIDKPNIRYTVHFGLPGSLESFYQEAGRAGRDRKRARCVLVYSEYDSQRSDSLLDPEIELSEIRARYEAIRGRRDLEDDVARSLWFHLAAFAGEEKDVADVDRILRAVPDLTKRNRLSLEFWPDDGDNKNQEKAILRLVKVGAFSDYEVDFGAKRYSIDVQPFDFEGARVRLLDHMQAAQPGRTKILARQLSEIRDGSPRELALQLARQLISFTYNVVERSRRRALQEAVLMARIAQDDAGIRERLLDYLQEGMGAEQIERLVEEEDVSLDRWCALLEHTHTAVDAGELRGLAIRALESFPEHPGLMLVRGAAEAMCSDAVESISAQALHAALRSAVADYELDESSISETVAFLFDLAAIKVPSLKAPLVLALYRLCEEDTVTETFRRLIRSQAIELDHPSTHAIIATFGLNRAGRTLLEASELASSRWPSHILAMLR